MLCHEDSVHFGSRRSFRTGGARSGEEREMVPTRAGLKKLFAFEGGIAVGNDNVTIALHKGRPSPHTLGHMSFHLPNMTALRKALGHLKKHKVNVEDPGDEIGPEAPGAPHMGLWFRDPDGYRWELSVQNAKK